MWYEEKNEIMIVRINDPQRMVKIRDIIEALYTYTRGIPTSLGDNPWGDHRYFEGFSYRPDTNTYDVFMGS